MNYDLLIIGTEREGIERAISAAQDGLRVAVIGTAKSAPSIELIRRAANAIVERREVTIEALRSEVERMVRCRNLADRAEIECLEIDWIPGQATFVSSDSVEVINGDERQVIHAAEMVIATGTGSWCPRSFYRDARFVLTVESLLEMDTIPQSAIVVGAGASGLAVSMLLATLGVDVLVVDENFSLLEMGRIFGTSVEAIHSLNIAFRLGDEVIGTELRGDMKAAVRLATGKVLTADAVVLCMGREGKTAELNIEAAGAGLDERGRIWCDGSGKTWATHVQVVGDLQGSTRSHQNLGFNFDSLGSLSARNFSPASKSIQAAIGSNRT